MPAAYPVKPVNWRQCLKQTKRKRSNAILFSIPSSPISEWWLEPNSTGPGAHLHEANDEIFYVIEGTASLLVGEEWIEASKGAFFMIPKNTMHDFANRSNNKTGLLNFFIPGGFERNMPSIVKWFEEN